MHFTYRRFFSFIILFSYCFFVATSHAAPRQYSSVDDFIQKQNIVRVCMTDGDNYGDQAGTMNVMSALRKMGFTGAFEVIYDKAIANKMSTLFGLPQNLPPVYEDQANKITFYEMTAQNDRIKNNTAPLVDLGLSVGKTAEICDPTDPTSATQAYTQTFVQFSPYFDSRGGSYDETDIELMNGKSIHQKDSGKKYFVFPVSTYADAKNYLLNDANGKVLLEQKPALMTFLEGMERKDFNVLPVYGRTLRFIDHYDELQGSPSPSNILQTLAGAHDAQLIGMPPFQKGLIIAVFDRFQPYAENLLHLMQSNDWGFYEKEGADRARQAIHDLKLSQVISVADVDDVNTIDKIKSLTKGQMLILSLGTLPKMVFDGLYTHTDSNIWPQVREGAGSFSTLILTGRPHFECGDAMSFYTPYNWTAGFDLIADEKLKTAMQTFYDAKNGYCGCTYDKHDPSKTNCLISWGKYTNYQQFGQFVLAANDPSSPLSLYFQALKADALKPENDRIRYALEGVMDVLNQNG